MIKDILINFPTNIGDTIIALPSLDRIKGSYPQAKITAIGSYQTNLFLKRHNFIDRVVIFDKHWPIRNKISFCFSTNKWR